METRNVPRIPLQVSQNCVVASIQVDLSDEVMQHFRTDLLELLRASGAGGVIIDLSGVDILDLEDFDALRRTVAMADLMGARTVLCGFRPGVVASLVELDANTDSIVAALNLDDAFRIMTEWTRPAGTEPGASDVDKDDDDEQRKPTETAEEKLPDGSAPDCF